MPRPALSARVDQPDPSAGAWITGTGLDALEPVAHAAGKPEVLFVVGSAASPRDDVLDLERPEDVALQTAAVSAPIPRPDVNACRDGSQYAGRTHGSSGGRKP